MKFQTVNVFGEMIEMQYNTSVQIDSIGVMYIYIYIIYIYEVHLLYVLVLYSERLRRVSVRLLCTEL